MVRRGAVLGVLLGVTAVASEASATDWHLIHLDVGLAAGGLGRHDAVLGYSFNSVPAVGITGFGGLRVGGGVYLAGPGVAPWESWTQVGLELQLAEHLNGDDASLFRVGPALHLFGGYDWAGERGSGGGRVGMEGEARIRDSALRFRLGLYFALDSDMGPGFATRLVVEYSVWPPIMRFPAQRTNPRL